MTNKLESFKPNTPAVWCKADQYGYVMEEVPCVVWGTTPKRVKIKYGYRLSKTTHVKHHNLHQPDHDVFIPDWIEHMPDNLVTYKSEPDCACGVDERHTHCLCCGRVISKGDWGAPPIAEWRIEL